MTIAQALFGLIIAIGIFALLVIVDAAIDALDEPEDDER